jgi:undecaprenyl-diphosphatase
MDPSSGPLTALAMGLLQGATEFLPISSSGHLAAFAIFADVPEMTLALVVLLHAATLVATIAVFYPDLLRLALALFAGLRAPRSLLDTRDGRLIAALVASTAATVATALLLRDLVEPLSRIPRVVGICLFATALALLTTRRRAPAPGAPPEPSPSAADAPSAAGSTPAPSSPPAADLLRLGPALLVGVVQGVAVLPGISRSGATIACAMALGLSAPAAFRYSFLLSVPAVTGATLLELSPGVWAGLSPSAWLAAATALVTGYLALRWLGRLVARGQLWLFAWYLVPVGVSLIALDLLGLLDR